MKKNLYFVNILHILTVGLMCLITIIIRAFSADMILPRINIPLLVLISLIPLVMEHYMVKEKRRNWLITILMAGITFGIIPLCAGLSSGISVWKVCVAGAVVFGGTDYIYTSIEDRMASGVSRKFEPIINAGMLFLASQCLQGLI